MTGLAPDFTRHNAPFFNRQNRVSGRPSKMWANMLSVISYSSNFLHDCGRIPIQIHSAAAM
jgi:hypothetical protein